MTDQHGSNPNLELLAAQRAALQALNTSPQQQHSIGGGQPPDSVGNDGFAGHAEAALKQRPVLAVQGLHLDVRQPITACRRKFSLHKVV